MGGTSLTAHVLSNLVGMKLFTGVVFILCWCPYIVFDLLQVYGFIPSTQTNIAVATFIQSLAPLNSAANPLIYFVFSTHFCRAVRNSPIWQWLGCRYRQEHETASNQSQSEILTNTKLNKI
ncbi:putative rhodopsin family 7 transmembrane receptor [Trypoxylus dichotomus]